MNPILIIEQVGDDKTLFHVEIKRGADQITDELELIMALGDDFAAKRWKIKAMKLTPSLWEVRILE